MKKQIKKLTRAYFCETYPHTKKIRRNDPLHFSTIFNDWKRLRSGTI